MINDHGYFTLLLLHLAQMVLGLEHQGLTRILYKIRRLLHPPGWSRRRGWQWWQARSDTPQGPTHRWEGARFFPDARSWPVTTLGHAEKGVQQGGLLNKYLIWSKWFHNQDSTTRINLPWTSMTSRCFRRGRILMSKLHPHNSSSWPN